MADFADDDLLEDESTTELSVLCILKNPHIKETLDSIVGINHSINFEYFPHNKINSVSDLEKYGCIFLEARIIEGFEDVQIIRDLRLKRPLVPIIAFNDNTEPSFMVTLFKSGATDSVSSEIIDEVLLQKMLVLFRLSESTRLVEVQNNQLVETMKAQREANEKRLLAEKERAVALLDAEANRQTKEIIDNLHKAFFTVNAELVTGDATSTTCVTIFGKDLAKLPLGNILNLADDKENFIRIGIRQVFDNFLPVSVAVEMLPKEVKTNDGKIVDLNYTCVTNKAGDPIKIIIVATDVTEVILERKRSKENEQLNLCLINILKNKEAFIRYVSDFKDQVETLTTCKDPILGKRLLHTLKGNSAAFGLENIARKIHDFESEVAKHAADNEKIISIFNNSAYDIKNFLTTFLTNNFEILKIDYERQEEEKIKIDIGVISKLKEIAEKSSNEVGKAISEILRSIEMNPFYTMMSLYRTNVIKIENQTGKIIDFTYKATNDNFNHELLEPIYKNLVHSITNSCVHGIEKPEIRKKQGKPEKGSISIDLALDGNSNTVITIKDDGQGMDEKIILEKAISKGLINTEDASTLSKAQILQFIFLDGFSTKDDIDDSAGRGVGMSSLKGEIEKLNATLSIKTLKNKGTVIKIVIPPKISKPKADSFEILIADDEEDILAIYKEILKDPKFKIKSVDNGLDAILEISKKHFDLLITDLNMPGLAGSSMISRIVEVMGDRSDMPIIVISGYLSEDMQKKLQTYRNVTVIEKPIRFALLLEDVYKALGVKAA